MGRSEHFAQGIGTFTVHEIPPDSSYEAGNSYTEPDERALEAREGGDPNKPLGAIRFHAKTGRVNGVFVYADAQRRGIASALWREAHERGYQLHHSDERTAAGDAWARKVGGDVPPLRRRVESTED